uniref:CUB domain-containing protein n=1 Tax=Glossina austeni TaxID=7395 RepID=A0A1A9VWD8_GLOAU
MISIDDVLFSRRGRMGRIVSPRHTLPPNTTCTYHFHGYPGDLIWLSFTSYNLQILQQAIHDNNTLGRKGVSLTLRWCFCFVASSAVILAVAAAAAAAAAAVHIYNSIIFSLLRRRLATINLVDAKILSFFLIPSTASQKEIARQDQKTGKPRLRNQEFSFPLGKLIIKAYN